MSKSSIISMLPYDLYEIKPGQYPSLFTIPKAEQKGGFTITVIGESQYAELVPMADDKAPPRMIDILSAKVAESIVSDYSSSLLGIDYELHETPVGLVPALPALFWLEGSWTPALLREQHKDTLLKKEAGMRVWFSRLVKIADDDWKRYGRHNVISDMQRKACDYLGLERDWNFNPMLHEVKLCPACAVVVNPNAAVCGNCKCIVNPEKYKKLEFANAL